MIAEEAYSIQFEAGFKQYFKTLHRYAFTILQDEPLAEDIVQQVFYKMWERRETLQISTSLQAYLYRAVHNDCLNQLKHEKVRRMHSDYIQSQHADEDSAGSKLDAKQLENKILDLLNKLPEQCRTVFQLSRFEELKYREIAERLQISVKTVEKHMSKALGFMRTELAEYLPIYFFMVMAILKNIFS